MIKKAHILLVFAILIFSGKLNAQGITGFVYDEDNNPIPYVKVYVKNFANVGGITDLDGKYFFGTDFGTFDVIYKCIGFEDLEVKVTVSNAVEPTINNVYLKQSDNQLSTVEIKTKKKNIGWAIVQNVIDHKKELIRQFDTYTCDIYIKGVETFDKKEKKKQKVEKEGETKDPFAQQKEEIRRKIEGDQKLNFVEINLTKHFEYPKNIKEIRTGYEKIGQPDQIYFQSTVSGDFNFYESLIRKDDLHLTPIVSPLHPSGILSYKYKLTEINTVGEDTIYTIAISPRSVGTSTMEGELYILKNDWVLTKVDVSMHKGNLKKYDDFRIVQEFEQKDDSLWLLKSQNFEYSTKYGRETVKGATQVVYSNYIVNPTFPKKFFSNEVGTTIEEAYERDSSYWDQIRPIPLSEEEQRKKFIQDSLTAIYTSEVYLDSVDSIFNKITFLKVAWDGIQHRDRQKKTQWFLSSVAQIIEPVNIGGARFGPGFSIFKKWEDEQWIDFDQDISIGFNNADLRGRLRFQHRYNPKKFGTYGFQFNRGASFINSFDAFFQTFNRQNIFQNTQGRVWHSFEIINGLFLSTTARLEDRSPFDLDYRFVTWFDDATNNGLPIQFERYKAFRTNVFLSYTPAQKYITEPNKKIILGSLWPTFTVGWEKGWNGPFNSIVDFDYISFSATQDFQIGTIGQSRYRISTGKYVNQDSILFIDRKFFRQSDESFFRFLFSPPLNSFQNLDSSYETQDFYLEGHYIHHFNGALVNKVPFLKKTGIKVLTGGGFIFLPEHNNYFYSELYFGIERIFKVARRRIRIGGYTIFSVANNQFALPDSDQPKNIQFKISFDILNERDLKFNF